MLEAAAASGGRTAIPSNVPKAEPARAEKPSAARGPERRDGFEPGEKGEKAAQAYGPVEKSGEGEADGMRALMEEIRRELSRQQAEWVRRLLESMREKPEGGPEKEDLSLRRLLLERAGLENPEQTVENAKNAPTPGLPGLDPYWNAENTSDRIVEFAMSYAGTFADAPEEFAAIVTGAVEEGFRQAQAITGELPGAAGELQKETYRLTMEKLTQQLETWKASLYNEPAQASAGP